MASPVQQSTPSLAEFQRVINLKNDIESTLKNTNWPKNAAGDVHAFLGTLQTSINLDSIPQLQNEMIEEATKVVEKAIRELEDVNEKLKNESTKYSKRRTKPKMFFASFVSPSGECAKLIREWRQMVETSLGDLNNQLPEFNGSGGGTRPNMAVAEGQANQTDISPSHEKAFSPEKLVGHKSTFRAVDAISGGIPVVGSFIGGVANLGLKLIDLVEERDQNDEAVKALENHLSELSVTLGRLEAPSQQDLAQAVPDLQRTLGQVENEIRKVFYRENNANRSKALSTSGNYPPAT